MYHEGSGSVHPKTAMEFLVLLLTCSVIITATGANPSPRYQGSNYGAVRGPSPTLPPTTTVLPFGYLATDLDYFNHERDSSEEVPEAIEISTRTVHNGTNQENPGNSTFVCPPCPTDGAMTSPRPAESVILDEVAELEKLMQKICSKLGLRKSLEQGAKKEGTNLMRLEDYCSVKLTYGYEGVVKRGWLLPSADRKDSVTVTAEFRSQFEPRTGLALIGTDRVRSYGNIESGGMDYENPRAALAAFQNKISNNGLN